MRRTTRDDEPLPFKERWALINTRERAETRRTPLTVKYRQFLALMDLGRAMKWPKIMDRETAQVRARWRRLWEHYRGQGQD